jgi:RHS repeat-associated protein
VRTFLHDDAGNAVYNNRAGGGYGYAYDAAGRMEAFSINGVLQATYRTDSLGQQVIRHLVQDGQVLHALHGPDGNRIAEYLYDPVSGGSTLLREYVWMDGRAVAVVEGGEVFFVRTDHIGRPVFATDPDGLKVWEASYLPFGGVHVSTGAIALRFPGQWFQSESGLHQNWMRDYDPTTGRYIQADPLGLVDGASVYGYALGNPLLYTDPTGECIGPAIAMCGPILAAAANVLIGILIDDLIGDGCYTLEELAFDAALGAALGPLGMYGRTGAVGASALTKVAPAAAAAKSLAANPFTGKTAREIAEMLEKKGYVPRGPDPVAGRGTYVNPQTGRGYHIDASHPPPKGPHVGAHRPRNLRDVLAPRDYPF